MRYPRTRDNFVTVCAAILCVILALYLGIALLKTGDSANNYATITSNSAVSFLNPQSAHTNITISSKPLSSATAISRYDFGVNDVWYDNGYGTANPSTEQPYNQLVSDTKQIGVSIIRYPGGNPSDLFDWRTAIGPQATRKPNVVDGGSTYHATAVLPSSFGPDEFGALLDKTGSVGDITVNFGTGSALEAAEWVCYETAPLHDSTHPACNSWSALRARNGHPAPYNVPYWEVGNEPNIGPYWRDGSVVSSPGNCKTGDTECLYVFGGTTEFIDQKLEYLQNQSPTGTTGPAVYMIADPPVKPGSETLHVQLPVSSDGSLKDQTYSPASIWRDVPEASLSHYHISDHVYAVDDLTGAVTFPTDSNGQTIPSDAIVTVDYQSGPHDGFISYYIQMKAANPTIHVCETYPAIEVLQLLGSSYPYDCYVIHDYGLLGGSDTITGVHNNYTAAQFHDQSMLSAEILGNNTQTVRQDIDHYAGKHGRAVQIVMSEYGILNYEHPEGADIEPANGSFPGASDYHSSLDLGLYVAEMLRNIIDSGVSVAEKHYLVGYDLSAAEGVQGAFDDHNFASNAMIDTNQPACDTHGSCQTPDFLLTPSADIFEAFSRLSYNHLVSSRIDKDPEQIVRASLKQTNNYPNASTGAYSLLTSLVTTDGRGHEAILVINSATRQAYDAELRPASGSYDHVLAWTVGAESYLAYNAQQEPHQVGITQTSTNYHGSQLFVSFPASSVSVLRFSTISTVARLRACSHAPSPPTTVRLLSARSTSVSLDWQAAQTARGCTISGYLIRLGNHQAATEATAGTVTGLTPVRRYRASVVAIQSNGDQSSASQAITVMTTPGSVHSTASADLAAAQQPVSVNTTTSSPQASNPTGASGAVNAGPTTTLDRSARLSEALRTTQTAGTSNNPLDTPPVRDQIIRVKYYLNGVLFAVNNHPSVPFYLHTEHLADGTYTLVTESDYRSGQVTSVTQQLRIDNGAFAATPFSNTPTKRKVLLIGLLAATLLMFGVLAWRYKKHRAAKLRP
jgi:alpha-N-arabinofuranosidase